MLYAYDLLDMNECFLRCRQKTNINANAIFSKSLNSFVGKRNITILQAVGAYYILFNKARGKIYCDYFIMSLILLIQYWDWVLGLNSYGVGFGHS